MEKTDVLRELDRAHHALMGAFTGLSEHQLEHDAFLGAWTVRDLLIHIVNWQQWFLSAIEPFAKGNALSYIPPTDINAINEQAVAARRDTVNMVQLVDDLTTNYRRMRMAAMGMSQAQLEQRWPVQGSDRTVTMLRLIETEIDHENEHAAEILAWRSGQPTQAAQPGKR